MICHSKSYQYISRHGTAAFALRSCQHHFVSFIRKQTLHQSSWRSARGSSVQCSQKATLEVAEPVQKQAEKAPDAEVRVRFAPSPTGNLHVGGARTALFNWLYAKKVGGKMILRIEDTDQARSTRESEECVMEDLRWLGLAWDEGPDMGGPYGPYRQSERGDIYKDYVDRLVREGAAYPCFCTDEELAVMKEEAEAQGLPPVYRGRWASAPHTEVEALLAKGTPHTFRFRVPPDEEVVIADAIRGEVRFNTSAVGDFVVLRSNGLPVYNFCVAVDDALMRVSHVLRAEEHLPNTLRQYLVYQALGFTMPIFGHVSLILAPDKSKMSKRHGATSVGEFREAGFLAPAMVNYLALLGWNDGTEQEIFALPELQQKFSLTRITKSGAVFDKAKLLWMNGQHLRALPAPEFQALVAGAWQKAALLHHTDSPFVRAAAALVQTSVTLVEDAEPQLRDMLAYPLAATLGSPEAKPLLEDGFAEVADALARAYESGELPNALAEGEAAYEAWLKAFGKGTKRRGRRLFQPLRLALTGRLEGPEIGPLLVMLGREDGDVVDPHAHVPLPARVAQLRDWLQQQAAPA